MSIGNGGSRVVREYFLVFAKKERLPQRSAKLYCYSRIID